jgi:acetolactate synthase-1/2/3 large subunit
MRRVAIENTGQALLEILRDLEVDFFFGNAGSDFGAIIDGFARMASQGVRQIQPVLVPHEFCAVSMAHGYYLASGKPPVVMVHSTVGTANALCALINASRSEIPLILMAGHPPLTEAGKAGSRDLIIHWAQEVFDQGGLVRQSVKWDHRLNSFDELEDVVRRAFSIAMSDPRGPVYVSFPRDLLEEPHKELTMKSRVAGYGAARGSYPDPQTVDQLAAWIAESKLPLIVTRSFGRDRTAVPDLVRLAESFAIGVVEFQIPEHLNFPATHPLHQGYPLATNPVLPQADLILAIDCPMPWTPAYESPAAQARVVHIAADPLRARYPFWGFRSDLAIAADSRVVVCALIAALEKRKPGRESTIARRFEYLSSQSESRRSSADRAVQSAGQGPSSFAWLSRCIGNAIRDRAHDTLVIQEYDLDLEQMRMDVPGTYFGFSPSGGLGFGSAGALGLQLARPDKTVIAVVGDGTYILGAPEACHIVAAMRKLPVLWIVCNNSGWQRVGLITRTLHAGGASAKARTLPLVDFDVPVAYEKLAESCGGYGEAVSSPEDIPAAVGRGLRVVREERRQALLNIRCAAI